MTNRKLAYGLISFLLVLSLILGMIIFYSLNSDNLKVVFLDVGQGDSILITQGQNQILIDGGSDGKLLLEKLGRYVPFWDRNIETVIATHPDQDHIGGLIDVLRNYQVNMVIKTGAESKSQTFSVFTEEIESNSNEIEAERNLSIKMGDNAEAEILYPFILIDGGKANDSSVVIKLNWKGESFLFRDSVLRRTS